jgi:hypothetical protein
MTRLFRLMLGIALVSAAACSTGTPTAPPPATTLTPNSVEPLLECVGGWEVQNGVMRPC